MCHARVMPVLKTKTILFIIMNLSRLFHCSVINVLFYCLFWQLWYSIISFFICQELFYFNFWFALSHLRRLSYNSIFVIACQQLFCFYFFWTLLVLAATEINTITNPWICQPYFYKNLLFFYRHTDQTHIFCYIWYNPASVTTWYAVSIAYDNDPKYDIIFFIPRTVL